MSVQRPLDLGPCSVSPRVPWRPAATRGLRKGAVGRGVEHTPGSGNVAATRRDDPGSLLRARPWSLSSRNFRLALNVTRTSAIEVGGRLLKFRKRGGLTQQLLANRLGAKKPTGRGMRGGTRSFLRRRAPRPGDRSRSTAPLRYGHGATATVRTRESAPRSHESVVHARESAARSEKSDRGASATVLQTRLK